MSGRFREFKGGKAKAVRILAIAFSLYELLYILGLFSTEKMFLYPGAFRALALCLILVLVFLLVPGSRSGPREKLPWYDLLFILASLPGTLYIFAIYDRIPYHVATATIGEQILGIITIVIVLEATRRTVGLMVCVLVAIFLFHALFCNQLPGMLYGKGYPLDLVIGQAYIFPEGIFGFILNIVVVVIFIFILFGAFLEVSGAVNFFADFAFSLVGHMRGGPAKVAVIASALMGTMSGSAVANAATTGTITIPLMKKSGYKPFYAGAIEAVSSTGGQLMPPIMGAVAFIMAEFLEMPYLNVVTAALIPAILYFLAEYLEVEFHAAKTGLLGLPRRDLPSVKKTLAGGFQFLIPFIVLIYFLAVAHYSVQSSCLYALASLVLVSMLRKQTRLSLKKILTGLERGAYAMIDITPVCASVGIIVSSISLTGLGSNLSAELISLSHGSMLLLLLLAALTSFIMGMGATATACYILLAVLVGPALIDMGVMPIAAHLFLLYWAMLFMITPPVCLAVYVTAGIAGASILKTGLQSMRLGLVAYVIPFIFVYEPSLLMIGTTTEIVLAIITSIAGVIALAAGVEGYLLRNLNWFERILFLGAGIGLMIPGWTSDIAATGVVVIAMVWQLRSVRGAPPKGALCNAVESLGSNFLIKGNEAVSRRTEGK